MANYYKIVRDHLCFTDALNIIVNNEIHDASMRIKTSEFSYKLLTRYDIPKDINEISLPIGLYNSSDWQIVIPDYDKEEKLDEIKRWLEHDVDGFYIDTRFYDLSKMNMSQVWYYLDEHFISNNEELEYEIMTWLKDTGRLNNKKI